MQVLQAKLKNALIDDLKNLLLRNDFEVVHREKNRNFMRKFRLNKSKIRDILLALNQDDYYGYDSDENQNEYGQAPIIMFIVKTVLINFHGVEEEIEIYIKIKVRREGILPVISFHQAEF